MNTVLQPELAMNYALWAGFQWLIIVTESLHRQEMFIVCVKADNSEVKDMWQIFTSIVFIRDV